MLIKINKVKKNLNILYSLQLGPFFYNLNFFAFYFDFLNQNKVGRKTSFVFIK